MEVILSTNRTGDDYYFDSQVDSSEGGMGPYWAIHWGSGIIKRLRTPALKETPRSEKYLVFLSIYFFYSTIFSLRGQAR